MAKVKKPKSTVINIRNLSKKELDMLDHVKDIYQQKTNAKAMVKLLRDFQPMEKEIDELTSQIEDLEEKLTSHENASMHLRIAFDILLKEPELKVDKPRK